MIFLYAFYNFMGFVCLTYKEYDIALFLFITVFFLIAGAELLKRLIRDLTTNQFTDGQRTAIDDYNEELNK